MNKCKLFQSIMFLAGLAALPAQSFAQSPQDKINPRIHTASYTPPTRNNPINTERIQRVEALYAGMYNRTANEQTDSKNTTKKPKVDNRKSVSFGSLDVPYEKIIQERKLNLMASENGNTSLDMNQKGLKMTLSPKEMKGRVELDANADWIGVSYKLTDF